MESEQILSDAVDNQLLQESSRLSPALSDEVILDDAFSYDGYQVVRGEFFAHVYEPSITFSNCRVSLNSACLMRLPNNLPDVFCKGYPINGLESGLPVQAAWQANTKR